MTAPRSAAEPLWKYGARAARTRSTGPLNLPMSANFPVTSARPGSVTARVGQLGAPHFCRNVYSGMSDVRRDASVRPMSSGAAIEWLPAFGALWQGVHVPWKESGSGGLKGLLTLRPPTPEMVKVLELKIAWPRPMARRPTLLSRPSRPLHASYRSNTIGVNGRLVR